MGERDPADKPLALVEEISAAPVEGEAPRYLISDLCRYLESYLPPGQVREVYRAYLFSAEAHISQKRSSGEPYIYHPLAVARILAEIRMDHQCLIAAMLHDVIEDTETAKEQIVREFGEEVAHLVDGVSKLTQFDFKSKEDAQAENFRKMLMAMTKDIRVILIKLADRLHNMRTLGALPAKKRHRIARETMDIYVPIANRLGLNALRIELEDLSMQACFPMRYQVLTSQISRLRGNRKELVGNIENTMRERLRQEGLESHVLGREKHIFSIYRKMRDKKLAFSDLVDVYAFRILVQDIDACYRALGIMHNLYKPVPGRFKDYIAIPKANGYQSIHTILVGPRGQHIELQIRTLDMHQVAEKGIAAHWHYKDEAGQAAGTPDAAAEWVRNLLELQKDSGTSMEFLEHVKVDLFPDEVYVFTPKGQIKSLPASASVLDFAYSIHSDIGNHCVAARVDHKLVPLRSRLHSGQTIEIITNPDAAPAPAWLDFVVTAKARAGIRGYLKRLTHDKAAELGKRLLEHELAALGGDLAQLPPDMLKRAEKSMNVQSIEQLYVEVGFGNRMAKLVAAGLLGQDAGVDADSNEMRLSLRGTEGVIVHYAKCCHPIPGDPIIGLFHPGKGVVIHHQSCPNTGTAGKLPGNWVDVQWENQVVGEYASALRVDVGNKRGMLATIAAAIAGEGSNIEDVRSIEKDGLTSCLRFVVMVRDRKHLAAIMRRLKAIPAVLRISRDLGRA